MPKTAKTVKSDKPQIDSNERIIELEKIVETLNKKIGELKHDLNETSKKLSINNFLTDEKNTFPINFLSEYLSQNGYLIKERDLFRLLRENGYLRATPKNFPSDLSLATGIMVAANNTLNEYIFQPRLTARGFQQLAEKILGGEIGNNKGTACKTK